jgi:cadmium resistance protein CadD (predicted permease)
MKLLDKILQSKNWIRVFLGLIVVIIIQKILGVDYISDELTLGAMGFISVLIGLYTADKRLSQ